MNIFVTATMCSPPTIKYNNLWYRVLLGKQELFKKGGAELVRVGRDL